MKLQHILFFSSFCLILAGCINNPSENSDINLPQEPDYTQAKAWYITIPDSLTAQADVFYIAPTCVWDWQDSAGTIYHFEDIYNPEQRKALQPSLELAHDIFAEECRMYAPYYRQITLNSWIEGESCIAERFPYAMQDIQKAFNYYINHKNNGRPFILAGFSQGAKGVVELLKSMSEETYSRLVAAYVIGYRVTQEELDKYPFLKAAQDSSDTRVTVCYNSVATTEAICPVLSPSAICINPINWSTTNAPAQLNDSVTVTIDTKHQVLIVNGFNPNNFFLPALQDIFKTGNYHLQELTFYQPYLKKNIKQRIDSYNNK